MPTDAGSIYADVRIRLDTLEKDILSIKSKLGNFVSSSQKSAGAFSKIWQGAFTALGFSGVRILHKMIAKIGELVGAFVGYQQSMKNVQSVTRAVGEEFRLMDDAAKSAGEETRFTARQAADALYYLGSAGFSARQSVEALSGVLELAGATQSDLASTAETVASVISQYSLDAAEAGRISNVFAASIGNSQATMEKLTASFRQVGPVAAGFGMTVEQTAGALQVLYNAGYQGENAGRALKSALADLAAPTENLKKVFGKLGIELAKVNPETNSMIDIMGELKKSGISTSQIIDAFGKVAGPQMAVLIKKGATELRNYTDAVTGTSAATEAYAIQNDSLAGASDRLQSKLESVAINVLEKLDPGMRDLIETFIDLLDAAQPVGIVIGEILNFVLKIVSGPLKLLAAGIRIISDAFKIADPPMAAAADAMDKATKSIKRAGEIDEVANKLELLTDEYESLKSKTNLTEEEQGRLRNVISQISEIVPSAITQFDDYGNAIEISGEKSKEARKQLLLSREAVLKQAAAQLGESEAIYKRIIREDKFAAQKSKENRNRLVAESLVAETRLALLETFQQKYNKLTKSGADPVNAYIALNKEFAESLKAVGVVFPELEGGMSSIGKPFKIIEKTIEKSNKTFKDLQKAITKPTEVEQRYDDAILKLKEITDAEKKLLILQGEIANLEKIDPVEKDVPDKVDAIKQKINEFWEEYKTQMEAATRESSLFGEKQDVLKAKLEFLKKAYIELLDQGVDPNSETLKKLRMEYDLTAMELDAYVQKLKNAEDEEKQSIKNKKDLEKLIVDYYQKIHELGKSESALIEIQRERAKSEVEAMNASAETTKNALAAIDIYYDKLKQNNSEIKDDFKETFDEILGAATQLASALISLSQISTQSKMEELDKELQNELVRRGLAEETEKERLQRELAEAIKKGDTEAANEKRIEIARYDLTETYEKKKANIQYKAARNEWLLKVASVAASAADAIMKSFPNPFLIAFSTAGAIASAAAVLKAKPKPPAFERGGVFTGPQTDSSGGSLAILHPPETVLNGEQMAKVFNMINQGGGNNSGTNVTVIVEMDKIIVAKKTAEVFNNGIFTLTQKAWRK